MRHLPLLAAAVGVLALGRPAHAQQNPATEADLKCMLVIASMMGNDQASDQVKTFAPMAFTYYLGKIKGREPAIDVQARLDAAFKGMQTQDIRPDAARCGAELAALSQETEAIGQHFKTLGAPPPAK